MLVLKNDLGIDMQMVCEYDESHIDFKLRPGYKPIVMPFLQGETICVEKHEAGASYVIREGRPIGRAPGCNPVVG